MPLGPGSTVNGIYRYGEDDAAGPLFSDLLNLLGNSVRAASVAGTAVVSIAAGSGTVTLNFGKTVPITHALVVQNSNVAANGAAVFGTSSRTTTSVVLSYTGGTAGSAQFDWQATAV